MFHFHFESCKLQLGCLLVILYLAFIYTKERRRFRLAGRTLYDLLLAEELRSRGYYPDILTKDYLDNLLKAAPMHDVGKIAVPDAILQKPGKLTAEEFE